MRVLRCILSLTITIQFATTLTQSSKLTSKSNSQRRRKTIDIITTDIVEPTYHSIERKTSSRRYGYLDSEGIFIALNALAKSYPFLVKLTSTQELYGLPPVGNATDCPYEHNFERRLSGDNNNGCYTWVLIIQDKLAHLEGSDSDSALPEVFINGAIHGDEMIGPTTSIETASLLLDAANCESLPHGMEPDSDDEEKWSKWEDDLRKARACRKLLHNRGINDTTRKWLARLVTTRRIVVVPTANPLAYYHGVHEENGINPKYDFPFDSNDNNCMQTITARGINELYRDHLFQISISFHSGENSIGYPYGSPSYLHTVSPDNEAYEMISAGLSDYGGSFPWMKTTYPYDQINDEFGPKHGRYEDWSYGASWISGTTCSPSTYGGYDESKTTYMDAMLRSMTFLIDTSQSKHPPRDHLGTDHDIFDNTSRGNGHIPRNVRLALMAIDLVQPYVSITSVNGLDLQDDIVPLSVQKNRMCKTTKVISIPEGTEFVTVDWIVGGGFTVDTTSLMHGKWSDIPEEFDGYTQPSESIISQFYDEIDGENGYKPNSIRLAPGGKYGITNKWYNKNQDKLKLGPIYTSSIETYDYREGDEIAIFALAEVDKNWLDATKDEIVKPDLKPQSHLVNARTNSDWKYSNKDKIINGRLKWFSIPVTITIGPSASITEETSERISSVYIHQEKKKTILQSFFMACGIVMVWSIIGYIIYKLRRKYIEARGKEYLSILQESERSVGSIS